MLVYLWSQMENLVNFMQKDGYYKGKALMDKIDNIVRQAYYDRKNVEVNKKTQRFYLVSMGWKIISTFWQRCYENI